MSREDFMVEGKGFVQVLRQTRDSFASLFRRVTHFAATHATGRNKSVPRTAGHTSERKEQ
jgi:hypothetical protein